MLCPSEAILAALVDGARRGGHFIVNMDTPAQLPAMVEPLYLALGARIDVQLALTPEDFEQAGRSTAKMIPSLQGQGPSGLRPLFLRLFNGVRGRGVLRS